MTAYEPADTILTAARNALRIIDTQDDVERLRVGTVLIDETGSVLEAHPDGGWFSTGERTEYEDDDIDLPAVIIYEPEN